MWWQNKCIALCHVCYTLSTLDNHFLFFGKDCLLLQLDGWRCTRCRVFGIFASNCFVVFDKILGNFITTSFCWLIFRRPTVITSTPTHSCHIYGKCDNTEVLTFLLIDEPYIPLYTYILQVMVIKCIIYMGFDRSLFTLYVVATGFFYKFVV